MKKKLVWQDLRDNSIDIEVIGQIAEDVSKYHIFGLILKMEKYNITQYKPPRGTGIKRSNIEISISRKRKCSRTKTTLDGCLRFFYKGIYYAVRMRLSAEAEYVFDPYDLKLQDYLYTYFTHVIEHDKRLQKFGVFTLPESLSNYYPGSEWDIDEIQDYHWMEVDRRFPMEIDRSLRLQKIKRPTTLSSIFRENCRIN